MKHIPSKLAILALLLALIMVVVASTATPASAATSGPLDAGTGANVNGPGTVAWTNAGNILADDLNYATAVIGATATSEYLQGTNYGFSIPLDATINGIAVSIMRMDSSGNGAIDADLYLLKAGAIVGTNHASATKWPTVMTAAAYGGAADLWGTTWTPAEINAAGFGLSLSALNTHPAQNRTATVDYMQITVTYTPAATPTTLTVDAATGTYGDTTSLTATLTVTAGGAPVAGRTISFTLNGSSVGSATTNGSGVATLNAASLAGISAGTYPTGVGASFAGDAGYGASSDTDSLTVNARDITVTADDKGKDYGDADPALTYQITSGSLVGGDSFSGAVSRQAGEDLGTYDVQQGTLALSANYNLTFVEGTFTISARDITVTADDKGKDYGDADPALTYQITSGSLVGGDSFSGAIARQAGEDLGTYDIQQGTLALSANYNLTFVEGTFTISARDITVTADDKGKTYGDADPALTYQITSGSLVGGDSFSGAISRQAGEDAGTYDIQQGTLALSANYNLTFVDGTFTISARDITVTADDKGKTYGDADPALTYQITSGSLLAGDSFSGALSRVAGENVGTYDITQGTLTAGANYNLTFVEGTFTVSTRDITVTADDKGKDYGDADPALTYQITSGSLVGGDSFSGAIARQAGEDLGTYDIQQGTLALSANYNLTFVEGTFTISPKALTITATNRSKTYGDTVTFAGTEFTAVGLVGSDGVTSVTLTSAGAAASATVAGSPYSIVPSAAVGTGLGNYTITYANGTLTVSPKALTITASNRSKTYGDAVTFAGTEFTASGLVNADTITSVTLTSAGAAASATVAGSPYSIVPSAAVGTGLGNYTITYTNGTLTVNVPAPDVTSLSPGLGKRGQNMTVVIMGTNLTWATSLSFGNGITVNSYTVNTDSRISVNITIADTATPGLRAVTVVTPGGTDTMANAFTVMPPAPTVDGVSPESGRTGDTFDVVISGSNFAGVTAVDFGPGVTVNSFVVDNPTQLTVRITIDQDTEPGGNNIVVTTPSGDGTLTEAFSITEEPSRGSGTWWIWMLISLLAALLGLLLFLLFGRRKKKTHWEVMARHSYSYIDERITVTEVPRPRGS